MRWLVVLLGLLAVPAQGEVGFDAAEVARILKHGPWPPVVPRDPSNRVAGNPAAIALGQRLFFEPRFSANGAIACASCHQPAHAWSDGRATSQGLAVVDRNAPSLLNVGLQHWFGWDGGGDSLWAQSIRPLLDPREMASSPARVSRLLHADAELACRYRAAFGVEPESADEPVLVNAAKALAAFQATLVSGRSAFDDFRDALARGTSGDYPDAAKRGLKLFVGRAGCPQCHLGPGFSNGEFHDVGVKFFIAAGKVDAGRYGGIQRLQASPYNRLGRFSDDPSQASAVRTRHVELQHRNWGEFKVPSLRNVGLTAPYMHNGSLASLRDVVRHYSELDADRLHADGEQLVRPLRLSAGEADDLVAFLESLTGAVPQPPVSNDTCR